MIYLMINQKYFDGNIINEDKLGFITEELKCFCPSPFFWDILWKNI